MKGFRHLAGVSSLVLDQEQCVGCGACVQVCPHGVPVLEQGKARLADPDGCMECGACALNCPARALSVTPGVGCAAQIIRAWFRSGRAPRCC